ncbi:MAG: hypothetical protein FJZ63_06285, partial [Chlamydiae bacterium]|nr:hypothetical protein [Chlamydiota bacterium]
MMLLDTIKIVTPEEMRFLEAKSIEAGHSSEGYMQKAGEGIAAYTALFIKEKGLKKEVTLVTGKGNNGGDAYVAGLELLKRGFAVKAFYLYDSKECSELNQKYFHKFKALGGRLYFLQKAALLDPYPEGVLLDGLLGTGFQGCVEGLLKEVIDKINTLKVEVLA